MHHIKIKNKKYNKFFNDAIEQLKKHKIKFKISKKSTDWCYYDCENDLISMIPCSKYNEKRWIKLFIHEYCHFLQDKVKKTKTFKKYKKSKTYLFEWLDKKVEYKPKTIKQMFDLQREVEYECEKMVEKIIDEYSLPLNKKQLAKEANSYIISYHVMQKIRNSKTTTKIYKPSITKKMPSYIKKQYVKSVPKIKYKLIESCYTERISLCTTNLTP